MKFGGPPSEQELRDMLSSPPQSRLPKEWVLLSRCLVNALASPCGFATACRAKATALASVDLSR